MQFKDLQSLYITKKNQSGVDANTQISKLLEEAIEHHKRDWEKNPTRGGDHEQSWLLSRKKF